MGSIIQDTKECPTVCIVMPVYNVAPFVERCVLSVMHQSHPANECIIVDDASTDDSIDRCKRLINKYNGPTHFFILSHDHNRGLSAARNTGTDAATSDYIYYLDSDDEMSVDCLENMMEPIIQDDSIEMVMGGFRSYYSRKGWQRKLVKNVYFCKTAKFELLSNEEIRRWYYSKKRQRPDNVWNKLLGLSFVRTNNLYNKEGQLFEDLLWSFYLLRRLKHAVLIHNVTYFHYGRSGSIVNVTKKAERIKHFGYILKEIASQFVSGERLEEAGRWRLEFCRYYIDASNSSDYQFAFNAFLRQLSDGKHRLAVWQLNMVYRMAKSRLGRILYKVLIEAGILMKRIVNFIICFRDRP